MRERGFWPVIAILAPDGRSATLAVRSGEDTFRGGKEETAKARPAMAIAAKEAKVERVALLKKR